MNHRGCHAFSLDFYDSTIWVVKLNLVLNLIRYDPGKKFSYLALLKIVFPGEFNVYEDRTVSGVHGY